MRVSRIRNFKNSTEVTLVLEGNDAQALVHAVECRNCIYPERWAEGKKLLDVLDQKVFKSSWKTWQD